MQIFENMSCKILCNYVNGDDARWRNKN